MDYWRENVDKILISNEQSLLTGKGSVSNAQMEEYANRVYDEFNICRKSQDALDADAEDMQELFELEQELKKR